MYYKYFWLILLSIVFFLLLVDCKKHRIKDGKLVLNPVEIIDLIHEERRSNTVHYKTTNNYNMLILKEEESTTECKDEETLRARKVWSRWSKWGACSVTCGGGSIARARVCLAGRCAPGEREEQRRPCARAPCQAGPDVDDLREAD